MGNELSAASPLEQQAAKESLVMACEAVKRAVRQVTRAERIDNDAGVLQVSREVVKICKEVAEKTAAELIKERRAENLRRAVMQADARSGTPQRVPRTLDISPDLLFIEIMRAALSDAAESRGAACGGTSVSKEPSGNSENWTIAHPWRKKEELGSGSFGSVYSAVDKNGLVFAVKEISKEKVDEDTLKRQVKSFSELSHRNVVRFFACAGDRENFYLYAELMQESLRQVIDSNRRPIPETKARKYSGDILQGLIYLHGKDVIHHNIKCSNVLLDSTGLAKLGDLEVSKKRGKEGTLPWMSPEVLSGQPGGKRSDIWSVGCTVFEMLKGEPPFMKGVIPVLGGLILPRMILGLQHIKLVNDQDEFGPSLKNFLSRIFVKLDDRQSAQQVAKHPWLRQ